MINSIINYLQTRSTQTKNRIMITAVITVALVLGSIWINGITDRLGSLTQEDIMPDNGQVLSAVSYVTIEAA